VGGLIFFLLLEAAKTSLEAKEMLEGRQQNMLCAPMTTTNRGSNRSQPQKTIKWIQEEQTIAKTRSNEVRPTCLRPRGN